MSELKDTFFDVGLFPVPHPSEDQPEDTKYRYVVNIDSDEVLAIVTKDYTLVENEKLYTAILPAIESNGGQLESCELFGDNNARVMYKFKFMDMKVTIGEDDDLVPELVIKNSYDGSTAITVMAGAFRMVCSNGMVIGKIVDYFKSRHLTDVDITKLESIINKTIENTIIYLNEKVAQLADIKPVKEQHILDIIQMFPDRMMERSMEYIIAHRPNDYWDLLNVTTNIATHHMDREAESTHKLEKKFLPTIMKMAGIK